MKFNRGHSCIEWSQKNPQLVLMGLVYIMSCVAIGRNLTSIKKESCFQLSKELFG